MRTRYFLDGEVLDLEAFLRGNEFEEQDVAEIRSLAPGQEMRLGGGAAPLFVLRRGSEEVWADIFGSGYEVPGWAFAVPGVADGSWGNDACPHVAVDFGDQQVAVSLWCDHPEAEEREVPEDSARFFLRVELVGYTQEMADKLKAAGLYHEDGDSLWNGDDEGTARQMFVGTIAKVRTAIGA